MSRSRHFGSAVESFTGGSTPAVGCLVNHSIVSPYSAILQIACGKRFDEIVGRLQCDGQEPAWTQAIGGAFALLAAERLKFPERDRLRDELEKLDRWVDAQLASYVVTTEHRGVEQVG